MWPNVLPLFVEAKRFSNNLCLCHPLPQLTFYFQPRYSVDDAAAAEITDLQGAGFSVADALAASVTDLRSAGCLGLEVRNPGEVKVRYKVMPLHQLWRARS